MRDTQGKFDRRGGGNGSPQVGIEMMRTQAKELLETPQAGRGKAKKEISPRDFGGSIVLLTL